jgi:hypothetical protein
MRMQEFYREIDENININRTFSIEDIGEQDRLHRFYIIGESVEIENILEDTEFLSEKIGKINNDEKEVETENIENIEPGLSNQNPVEN